MTRQARLDQTGAIGGVRMIDVIFAPATQDLSGAGKSRGPALALQARRRSFNLGG